MEKREELIEERKKIEERIKHLEKDLKSPLSQDLDENAMQIKNREVLYSLYEVEKQNLVRIEGEIINSVR
jgi:RNA polymerase-binding transcription factor DksA